MSAELKRIPSSRSVDMSRKRKVLFGLLLGFSGAIVGFTLIYTSKRMAFETWENFVGLLFLIWLSGWLVLAWLEGKRRRSE
jgi:hypothetical protein